MIIEGKRYDEERALYGSNGIIIKNCCFDGPADGESALKESENVTAQECFFNLRYPLWHVDGAWLKDCRMTELCRAALWYDKGIRIEGCELNGIKAIRECSDISLVNSTAVSAEFMWKCRNIEIADSTVSSEYFAFECKDMKISHLKMKGMYSFQYVENAEIRDSQLDTKDAFWHSKNVTVYDSVVQGEYLGWYAENLRFVRCRIIGTQPLCYCKGLVLDDCTMENTDLCFERSEVKANILGNILSVKNPISGKIVAGSIDEIILEREYVDPDNVKILCGEVNNGNPY